MSALDRTERFVVQAVHVTLQGEIQECLNSTTRGYTMPAFTFEKLSPPVRREPVAPIANKKQRGVIVQMLDRFVEARVKRTLQEEEKGVIARYKPPE
jgi:hypothetical protein